MADTNLVGQTIYDTQTGEKCEVIAVTEHPRIGPQIAVRSESGGRADYSPELFWKYFSVKKVKHADNRSL